MGRIRQEAKIDRWRYLLPGLLMLLVWGLPVTGKTATDFNPDLDFSKYKSFAYVGGVEQNLRKQLNPQLLDNRIHRAVTRELTAKGLREVSAEENPDLVVRYWVEGKSDFNITNILNWGVYGSYFGGYWGYVYYTVSPENTHQGTLGIELIDARVRDLAWRMFGSEKNLHIDADKNWKKVDNQIQKAFKDYPPSAKDIEDKKKERAKEDPAKKP